jgi:ketosteroid isomerase-like protein
MSTLHDKPATFDWAAFRRSYERLDSAAVRDLVSEDVECIEIDSRTQPSAPARLQGADALVAAIEDIASRGLQHEILDEVVGEDKAAFHSRCRYPDGKLVEGMAFLEIEDGRIKRMTEVQAFDE